jgi:hypothetical protein
MPELERRALLSAMNEAWPSRAPLKTALPAATAGNNDVPGDTTVSARQALERAPPKIPMRILPPFLVMLESATARDDGAQYENLLTVANFLCNHALMAQSDKLHRIIAQAERLSDDELFRLDGHIRFLIEECEREALKSHPGKKVGFIGEVVEERKTVDCTYRLEYFQGGKEGCDCSKG